MPLLYVLLRLLWWLWTVVGAVLLLVLVLASPRLLVPAQWFVADTDRLGDQATVRDGIAETGEELGDDIVMVSLSGGGSRAAFFGAAVLGELQRLGASVQGGYADPFVSRIDAVSSVSGGSLAAAYLVLNRDALATRVPAIDAGAQPWRQFNNSMAADYRTAAVDRLLSDPWRMLTVLWGESWGHVLTETFHETVLQSATMSALPVRPRLFINATETALGQFVFAAPDRSRAPAVEAGPPCGGADSVRLPAVPPDPELLTLEWANVDASGFALANAVYASAAVPGLLPPFVLRGYDAGSGEPGFLKLADAGVWDNTGTVALYQFIDRHLHDRCGTADAVRTVTMLDINANNVESLRVELRDVEPASAAAKALDTHLRAPGVGFIGQLPGVLDVIYQRREEIQEDYYAATYRPLLCERYPGVRFRYPSIRLLDLRYVGRDDLARIGAGRRELARLTVSAGVADGDALWNRVHEIPTDFRLSAEHVDLLTLAAGVLVEHSRDWLESMLFTPDSAEDRCEVYRDP